MSLIIVWYMASYYFAKNSHDWADLIGNEYDRKVMMKIDELELQQIRGLNKHSSDLITPKS